MNNKAGFVLKVLFASAIISAVIKYVAPGLAIPATSANALIAVLSPSLIMAVILGWRAWRYTRSLP
ncbi:hypothetical protein IQ268_01005 [Oculatella sp. LEGE 06141]|uniref:hypothetical protein n=1 Tax=Oculatella sp. LEGE 06141 TaxID=1828648 RepID=UPI001882D77D|nr:hypothetical protein [Oculatella sp. LEGE 06141]MBE9177153.1 hypothetical protein [Oculatella sp. LEGE 06141]